jgi:hypothetical protein
MGDTATEKIVLDHADVDEVAPFILEAVAAGGFVEWARSHPPVRIG